MHHFFVTPEQVKEENIWITGSDVNHIKNVLRMKLGEELEISDGNNKKYLCEIASMSSDEVVALIKEELAVDTELPSKIYLFQGIPKSDKMELIVQKAVELGVYEIIPVATKRAVVKLDDKKAGKKVERWQRIAEEAAKQSGRGIIPQVSWAGDFTNVLDIAVKKDLALFMYETGEREALDAVLGANANASTAAIITGPEGGFAKFEADLARACGLHICSMGERILRCETAPVVALTAMMYATGNLS